jgi:hypothetical protein
VSVITVTPTVEASNVPARVRLNVADTGTPALTTTTITRLNPDGTTSPVRTPDGNPVTISGGSGLVYDYEAPYGQVVTYSSAETPGNVSGPVTVPVTRPWLIHPGMPTLSMPIDLRVGALDEETLQARQAMYWPMGRSTPVVIGDGARKAAQSSLIIGTETSDELSGIRALFADASVLLLNVPPSLGLGFDTCYIAPGEVRIARRPNSPGAYFGRDVSVPFTVVARPGGGTQSERTLSDLLVYPSITALNAQYATLADLLAGP